MAEAECDVADTQAQSLNRCPAMKCEAATAIGQLAYLKIAPVDADLTERESLDRSFFGGKTCCQSLRTSLAALKRVRDLAFSEQTIQKALAEVIYRVSYLSDVDHIQTSTQPFRTLALSQAKIDKTGRWHRLTPGT